GGPATVTDANLVLGRLDPARFPAVFGPEGRSPLDAATARAALSDLAARMDLPGPEAAAEGFLAVAVEQTAQAVRRISTERGFDPRDHALVAFGGAAGQVACDVAEALGIDEVLCPGQGSVLSAWGMGQARPTVLRQAGLEAPLDGAGLGAAADLAARLGAEALAGLSAQGIDGGEVQVRLGLRYDGADAVLAVPPGIEGEVRQAFEVAHRRLFGFTETDRAVLVARVEAEAVDATLPPPVRATPPRRS
ncbi:MAG: 5-oxoprolinase, partial [Phenylobacterium sp.]|nr:5-oxoprolinase [Phenylobacterium sp.]